MLTSRSTSAATNPPRPRRARQKAVNFQIDAHLQCDSRRLLPGSSSFPKACPPCWVELGNAISPKLRFAIQPFFFLALLWVLNAIFVIIAAIKASDGEFYRHPMTIRFIQ